MRTNHLKGIRVLDLSRMLSGPYCTMILADHGAEVIKIESTIGDTSRHNGPYFSEDLEKNWAGYFVSLNRNKKSVQLDLKTPQDKEAFRDLAKSADVVVENFRPGVMERLGLSYESLIDENPSLVYAAIRGFGDPRSGKSPYSTWPSYDVVAQAMGGVMAITGQDKNNPTKVGPGIGDIFSGLMMSFGIMAALRQAEANGKGQFVDIAMYDAVVALCERSIYLHNITGEVPVPEGNFHPLLAPFGLFPASDGFIALGIVDDDFWVSLCKIMGKPGLGKDPKYLNREARCTNATSVNSIVCSWTSLHTKEKLAELLGGVVPFGPLNTVGEIFCDKHIEKRKMLLEIPIPEKNNLSFKVAANPLRYNQEKCTQTLPPPALGQHTKDYLRASPKKSDTQINSRSLRDTFGTFTTGVTVVTTRESNLTPRGFTANSFSSVSLDPPLLLICINKSALSSDVFNDCKYFGVNILSEDQKDVAGLFASKSEKKFKDTPWFAGVKKVPIIQNSLSYFVCKRQRAIDAGDHIVLFGEVLDYGDSHRKPLGYYRGTYFSLGAEETLIKAATAKGLTTIGAILENKKAILLEKLEDGSYKLPTAPVETNSLGDLKIKLEKAGLRMDINSLYAVYQDSITGCHSIYYHGRVVGKSPHNMKYFALADLPLEKFRSDPERTMLSRYQKEYKHGTFGIYQGDENSGIIHQLTDKPTFEN